MQVKCSFLCFVRDAAVRVLREDPGAFPTGGKHVFFPVEDDGSAINGNGGNGVYHNSKMIVSESRGSTSVEGCQRQYCFRKAAKVAASRKILFVPLQLVWKAGQPCSKDPVAVALPHWAMVIGGTSVTHWPRARLSGFA
ncbi:hypothetical protein BU15DRAFT_59774 [Melanogaster broomeanus]|nr:hypothetical protein BU15DRAFT_59774 [Melanogaster broomeanus]